MSLINDALRKAQKQRTGESPPLASMPAIGGESAVRIAKRARPAGFYPLLIRLGAGAALLTVVIIGGVVLLRKKTLPADAQHSAGQTPGGQPALSLSNGQPNTVQPLAQQPATAVPPPAATVPAATTFVVPLAAPPVATPRTEPPAPRTETPKPVAATVATTSPVPVKPATPGKLEPKAIIFIESIKVAGIRASSTDSKVLMNDRVYRIGNTIEHEMGIKLTGITANSLTFEDERGGSYTRTF